MTPPETYMCHALALARRGLGNTAENPSVGCVIVQNDRIVGRGYTQAGGRPHAETMALQQAGTLATGAEVFVTLEPCSHHGKTPPCVEALIAAKISKVWIALEDPNPEVHGAGIARLKQAGIAVEMGLCHTEALFLNQGYIMRRIAGRPLVCAKIATTQDGRMALANGASQWITGAQARKRGQAMRASFDCLLSGIGTVLADNPRFTCRLSGLEHRLPLRAIVDSMLRIPIDSALVQQAKDHPLRLYCLESSAHSAQAEQLQEYGVEVCLAPAQQDRLNLRAVMQHLAESGVNRVMLEAGETLTTSAIQHQLIDRLMLFRGNALFGSDAQSAIGNLSLEGISHAPKLYRTSEENLGEDRLETFIVAYPPCHSRTSTSLPLRRQGSIATGIRRMI